MKVVLFIFGIEISQTPNPVPCVTLLYDWKAFDEEGCNFAMVRPMV
jgi:hypothetical protein